MFDVFVSTASPLCGRIVHRVVLRDAVSFVLFHTPRMSVRAFLRTWRCQSATAWRPPAASAPWSGRRRRRPQRPQRQGRRRRRRRRGASGLRGRSSWRSRVRRRRRRPLARSIDMYAAAHRIPLRPPALGDPRMRRSPRSPPHLRSARLRGRQARVPRERHGPIHVRPAGCVVPE